MVITTLTIEDTLPHGIGPSNKKVDFDTIAPFLFLALLQLIASISCNITILIMVLFGVGALYLNLRPRQNRSPFLYSWNLSSIIYMFLVFQIKVIRRLRLLQTENFVFLLLVACTLFFFYKMKTVADSQLATCYTEEKSCSHVLPLISGYCQMCTLKKKKRFFFYSGWWDCYVNWSNYVYFLIAYGFAFATLTVGVNWGLKILCTPYEEHGPFVLPHGCDDVYLEFRYAIGYVACIYGGGYLLVVTLVIAHQLLIFFFKCIEPEWRQVVNVVEHIKAHIDIP